MLCDYSCPKARICSALCRYAGESDLFERAPRVRLGDIDGSS